MSQPQTPELEHLHTKAAIRERLNSATHHSYLGDFVLGAIDGTVTTFAVVTGAAGAGLSTGVALILGFANLVADGFSMAVGNYLNVQSARHVVDKARRIEERHIDLVPEGEREEVRQIFTAKGFEEPLLSKIVDVITRDRQRWIDTMITDEFGLQLDTPSPWRAGIVTYAAFVVAGFVPLMPLLWRGFERYGVFTTSCLATGLTFFLVGIFKGHVVHRPKVRSGLETLAVGAVAAAISYFVGMLLSLVVSVSH